MPTKVNTRENQFSLTRAVSINRRRGKKQIPISNELHPQDEAMLHHDHPLT
jgi:hypothetical protein